MPYRLMSVLLLACCLAAACSPTEVGFTVDNLPEGDATRGETLFTESVNDAAACNSCHRLDTTKSVGPGLGGYAGAAGNRVSGQDARTYTFNSIIQPGSYLVRGFSNIMYNNYAEALTEQDIADLIAYLLTLQ